MNYYNKLAQAETDTASAKIKSTRALEIARATDKDLSEALKVHKDSSIRLGQLLIKIRDERLYEQLGHRTFKAYMAIRGIHKSSAHHYMRAAALVEQHPAARDIPASKLILLSAILGKRAQAPKAATWIARARRMTHPELAQASADLTRAGYGPLTNKGGNRPLPEARNGVNVPMTDACRQSFEDCITLAQKSGAADKHAALETIFAFFLANYRGAK